MSDHDDADGVIHRLVPDDQAERLLAGGRGGSDGDLAPVAHLFAALREPGRPGELVGSDELFTQVMTAGRRRDGSVALAHRRSRPLARQVSGKVAVVVAVVAFSGGAAAASTGRLPDPVQRRVAAALSNVGIDLPSPGGPQGTPPQEPPVGATTDAPPPSTRQPDETAATIGPGGSSHPTAAAPTAVPSEAPAPTTASTPGGTVTGPEPTWTGPCRAYAAVGQGSPSAGSEAFADLAAAATAAGVDVAEFCALRGAPGSPVATAERPGSRGSTPAATAPGQVVPPAPDGPATETSVPVPPGRGGSTPAATAPGAPGDSPGGAPPSNRGSTPPGSRRP